MTPSTPSLLFDTKSYKGNREIGPDVHNGGVCNMMELGVYEPTELVRQAVLSASEVTNSILRIDDIIARRPAQ